MTGERREGVTDQLMHIGGAWVPASNGACLEAINPATEEVFGTFPDATAADVGTAVAAAAEAQESWKYLRWAGRAEALGRLAQLIEENADEIARIDALDAGKPIAGLRRESREAAAEVRHFAGLASETRGSSGPAAAEGLYYTSREPYGVVARIVPFNHPFKFAAGKVAAPLAAGNTVVLKPGEQTSMSAFRLAQLAERILPAGVLNVVTGSGAVAGAALVEHPGVPRVASTGSVPTGRSIVRSAAEHMKHVSLELGGKNPLRVFPDVDPKRAAAAAAQGMNIARSNGQSCGSNSRIFVHDDIREDFLDELVAVIQKMRIGDPMDESTEIGPLAFRTHYERVMRYIETGRREGATLLYGGTRPEGLSRGYFVEPAVFADVRDEMTIAREEIFGPVLSVLSWNDREDVIRRANALPLGLTANVWSNDISVAHRTAASLEAGYVYINGNGRRPKGSPFGSWKQSGLGKENGIDELISYTREKTVAVTFL